MPKRCECCGRKLKKEKLAAFDPSDLNHGLYRIYWLSGGSSYASVGSYSDGRRWMAPTNWVNGESGDWSGVLSAHRIRPDV